MPELLSIQRDMAESLRDAAASAQVARWLVGEPDQAERRLAIYRANVAASTTKALRAAYPVIAQVVGDEYFDGLARAYAKAVPSTSGDLADHGAEFAGFLAQFEPARSLPYLPDLARLEWAAHRAYSAEDAAAWDHAALAEVSPENQSAIRFRWAAGTAVVASPYPIARLWTIHHPDYDGEFKVDWSSSECAWIARDGFRVVVAAVDSAQAAFIAASLSGSTLGASTEAALAANPDFDLGRLLARAVASNAICGFTVNDDEH